MQLKKIFVYWRVLLFLIIILYGSLTSNPEINRVPIFNIPNGDKIVHFSLYFILSILLISALYKNTDIKEKDQKLLTIIFVISYGLLMEVFQFYFTISRTADILDVGANSIGCLFGILVFPLIKKMNLVKFL